MPTTTRQPLQEQRLASGAVWTHTRESVTARSCAIDLEATLGILPGSVPAAWARKALLSSSHGWAASDPRWTDEGVLLVERENEYGDTVLVRITVEVVEP